MRTIGQAARDEALAKNPNDLHYDPERPLRDDEERCGSCGFISTEGTSAQRAHDDLCDEVLVDPKVLEELHPAQLEQLESMVKRNVTFYPMHLWDKAVQVEILDRGLVAKGDREHEAILAIVEREKLRNQ